MNETETLVLEALNVTNGTLDDVTEALPDNLSPTMIALIFMLLVFFIIGTIGNALAFIIYYRKREKGTSTIFIISLTVTDFLTCLITIPWTLTHELTRYKYNYDILCRLYVFMNTFNIPLSSLILVVIGFDRYFCICHPFLHVITVPRAKIIIFVLIVVAILLGVVPFLGHSIYYVGQIVVNETISTPENFTYGEGLYLSPTSEFVDGMQHGLNITTDVVREVNQTAIVFYGHCVMSQVTISRHTLDAYQSAYASIFLLEFVVIMILYALIFRSIILRRAWRAKRRQKSSYSAPSCVDAEETQLTNVNGNNGTETTTVVKKNSSRISAAMRDRTLYANIRTAAMLFVVTVVFVVSFLPSWLTGLRMIDFQIIVFYVFYFNNVANPIIYAFMNRTFRDELVLLIKNCLCRR